MSVTQCLPVSMAGFKQLVTSVSPDITVVVRGRHAVGKSEAVYQCAEQLGLPVVERRLSQMTEGDTIGLPRLESGGVAGTQQPATQFLPCDWLIKACEEPVMLFLDERNRAIEAVKQAIFQLADSKLFYGHRLHEGTRIIIAENVGDEYQVNQSDPAEVSRGVTVELDPTVGEFLEYAEPHLHPATIEFIRANQNCLEHKGPFEGNKKYPDRRAWFKLDKELQRLGLLDADDPGHLLYIMAGAFLGPETGAKYNKFVLERERQVKAEDVLKDWKKAKKRLSKGQKAVSNEQYVELTHKLGDWLKEHSLEDSQAREFSKFMHDCPPEPRMAAWALLQKRKDNLFAVHPYIEKLMVATASGEDTTKLSHGNESGDSSTEEGSGKSGKSGKKSGGSSSSSGQSSSTSSSSGSSGGQGGQSASSKSAPAPRKRRGRRR